MQRWIMLFAGLAVAGCATSAAVPMPPDPTATAVGATTTPPPKPTATAPAPAASPEVAGAGTDYANSEWADIPLLPGAQDGRFAGPSYVYAAAVTVDEAEAFFMDQLKEEGWELSGRQASDVSMFGGPAVFLDFQRASEAVNIMLIFSASEQYTMVALTRIAP